jgi:hypothetical protein
VLFTVFLLYPNVSSTILNMFVCKDIEGQCVLLCSAAVDTPRLMDVRRQGVRAARFLAHLLQPALVPLHGRHDHHGHHLPAGSSHHHTGALPHAPACAQGIPAVFLYFLHKYRKRLREPGVRVQLGFLYEAYTPNLWYFEVVDMLYKLIMTSLIGFIPIKGQVGPTAPPRSPTLPAPRDCSLTRVRALCRFRWLW